MDASVPHVRIRTLGRFQVVVGGAPIEFKSKAQRKPLELLKVLIAFGGDHVPLIRITDVLWPDADGDAAQRTFAVTLHRLRALIGKDSLILKEHLLTLSPEPCEVDALQLPAMVSLVDTAVASGEAAVLEAAAQSLLALYGGRFLEGEEGGPEILAVRNRLHRQFLRAVMTAGRGLESAGSLDAAVSLYRRAADVDPSVEDLQLGLMQSLLTQGRAAEALSVAESYRDQVHMRGEESPSAAFARFHRTCMEKWERTKPGGSATSGVADLIPPLGNDPSLAVAPFHNLSDRKDLEYFNGGLYEDLVTELAQYAEWRVVAGQALTAFETPMARVLEIGQEIGVRYVLDGSVQVSDEEDRVRVTCRLIDVGTRRHVWAERYDRPLQEVFRLQTEIAAQIALALDVKLLRGQAAERRWRTARNVEAYKLSRRAEQLWMERKVPSLAQAKVLWKEAAALDPSFAYAWVGISWTYCDLIRWGESLNPQADLEEAGVCLDRAFALVPEFPEGHCAMSNVHLIRREFEKAIEAARRATTLEPDNGYFHCQLASILISADRWRDGISMMRTGIRMVPSPFACMYLYIGNAYFLDRHYDAAASALNEYTRRIDNYDLPHALRAAAFVESGDGESASRAKEQLLTIRPDFTSSRVLPYLRTHRTEENVERVSAALAKLGL